MLVKRVSIEEHLPAPSDDHPGLHGKVHALVALKSVAVGLDQVVNRCMTDIAKWGHVDPGTAKVNEADFAEAEKQLHVLAVGLKTGHDMLAALKAQLGYPAPEPEAPAEPEKPAKGKK